MVNMLIIAAGAVAVLATALAIRVGKRRTDAGTSATSVGPVSEEWLSNARGQGEHHW
jgi:hypothetical protein